MRGAGGASGRGTMLSESILTDTFPHPVSKSALTTPNGGLTRLEELYGQITPDAGQVNHAISEPFKNLKAAITPEVDVSYILIVTRLIYVDVIVFRSMVVLTRS